MPSMTSKILEPRQPDCLGERTTGKDTLMQEKTELVTRKIFLFFHVQQVHGALSKITGAYVKILPLNENACL